MVRASLAASTAAKYSSRPFLLLRRCGLKGARGRSPGPRWTAWLDIAPSSPKTSDSDDGLQVPCSRPERGLVNPPPCKPHTQLEAACFLAG